MEMTRARVSFELSAFSCSPSTITAILGVAPTSVGERGQPYVTIKGKPTSRLLDESYWSLWSPDAATAPLGKLCTGAV